MKSLLAITLISMIGLLGCAEAVDSHDGSPGGVDGAQNVTDLSVCRGANHNVLNGGWEAQFSTNRGFEFTLGFYFTPNRLTISNMCQFEGMQKYVSANAPIQIASDRFEVLEAADQSTTDGGIECSVSVDKATVHYRFQGPCLVLSTPEGETTLVPSN